MKSSKKGLFKLHKYRRYQVGKQNGKQRCKCKTCRLLFIRKHAGVSYKKQIRMV